MLPSSPKLAEAVVVAPGEERADNARVRVAGVWVFNFGRKELDKTPASFLAGFGEERR
jgi:hypothetical protein